MIKGIPGHNTPEVSRGPRRDCCADLYFLGVVLYEALTKKRSFPCEEAGGLIEAHLHHRSVPYPVSTLESQIHLMGSPSSFWRRSYHKDSNQLQRKWKT